MIFERKYSREEQPMRRRKRLPVVMALVLFVIHPAILAQSGGNERWGGKWSTANRSSANAIRAWPSIRTGNAYDAVMDFDAVTERVEEIAGRVRLL